MQYLQGCKLTSIGRSQHNLQWWVFHFSNVLGPIQFSFQRIRKRIMLADMIQQYLCCIINPRNEMELING
jgi:hypothetical protein